MSGDLELVPVDLLVVMLKEVGIYELPMSTIKGFIRQVRKPKVTSFCSISL